MVSFVGGGVVVDDITIDLNSSGQIQIKNGALSFSMLSDDLKKEISEEVYNDTLNINGTYSNITFSKSCSRIKGNIKMTTSFSSFLGLKINGISSGYVWRSMKDGTYAGSTSGIDFTLPSVGQLTSLRFDIEIVSGDIIGTIDIVGAANIVMGSFKIEGSETSLDNISFKTNGGGTDQPSYMVIHGWE